jgi:hypothetical protein
MGGMAYDAGAGGGRTVGGPLTAGIGSQLARRIRLIRRPQVVRLPPLIWIV